MVAILSKGGSNSEPEKNRLSNKSAVWNSSACILLVRGRKICECWMVAGDSL